ncbi:MAG: PilN domain-containing protein [Planctomycetota bacterium]
MSDANNQDRRKEADRRTGGERRRSGEGRHVVLHFGRAELSMGLIVSDGRGAPDLLHTAETKWRHDGPLLPNSEAVETLAERLKALVAQERIAGASASLVLNGDLCITRVASGPAADVRKSLDEIDDRSQLYLSLGPGPKTIARAKENLDARHERAVVSVACEASIQQLIDVVAASGLDLQLIEAETVALARVHGALHPDDEEPVLIVECDADGFEIAVASKGCLLLDYRPGPASSDASLIDVLTQHHARLERFCQRQTGDFNFGLKKVYLAGEESQVVAAEKALSRGSVYAAEVLDTNAARRHWPRPPETLGPSQAALVGRLLREIDAAPEAPAPNLIERWIAESRAHIRPMLIRSALPLVAVLLLAAGVAVVNWHVRQVTDDLTAQLDELAPAKIEHDALRLRMIAAQDKLHRLQKLSDGIEDPGLTALLASIGGCLPDDVWLDRFSVTDVASARVSGASYSESGVYDFVRHLNAAPMFEKVALEGTGFSNTPQGPATSFDVKFLLAEPTADTPGETPQ